MSIQIISKRIIALALGTIYAVDPLNVKDAADEKDIMLCEPYGRR
jgi:hypothetical protein